ncbi:unnamed protein product, partial [Schistosoma turkestanicum]
MLATNDIIKSQYETLLHNRHSMNSWLPLPHPCVFTSNWSSLEINMNKSHSLACLHSKRTFDSNASSALKQCVKESCLNINEQTLMTKDANLNSDISVAINEECETDSNIIRDEHSI